MSILAASTVYPVAFVTFTAFKSEAEYARDPLGPPSAIDWSNIAQVLSHSNVTAGFAHTTIVAFGALVLLLAAAMLAGFILAWGRFRFRRAFTIAVVLLMIQPAGLLMIPMVLITQQLGLRDTFLGAALVYAALLLPFATYFSYSYFRGIPGELLDAAEIDGGSLLRAFWSIALPLARPAISTLATLSFLTLWNDFLFALLLLVSPGTQTLVVAVQGLQQTAFSVSVPTLAAGLLFTMVPPVVLFVALQRGLISGISAGSLR